MNYRMIASIAIVSCLAFGCATVHPPSSTDIVDRAFPQRAYPISGRVNAAPASSSTDANRIVQPDINHHLTLDAAIDLTVQCNPTLAAFSSEIHSRDAARQQSGLPVNPTLGVDVDNFAGRDDLQGFDGAETTIMFSQLFELGGKRNKRRQLASVEKDIAGWDYHSKKLDLIAATTKTFIQVLAAQAQQLLNAELVSLAEQTYAAVGERVDGGKVSPVEKTRAQIELTAARSEANRANHQWEAARRRLAALWSMDQSGFWRAAGDLSVMNQLPDEQSLQNHLHDNPDVARWATELDQRQTAVSLANAQGVPDLTLNLGWRTFQESDRSALVAGIELPLPLFDRNQGGIAQAQTALIKARQEQQAAVIAARSGLSETWQNLAAAHAEVTALHDGILPGARSAFEAADFGYREGKLDFLQMLEAQRTLFTVKRQYLAALEAYHLSRADVGRFIGASFENFLSGSTE